MSDTNNKAGSNSRMHADDNKYIANTYKRMKLVIERADSSYLIDSNGNAYLDMFSGIGVNNLRGRDNKLEQAAINQINRYMHLSNHFCEKNSIKLAKLLIENTVFKKVFYTNSGTEANEAAIKAAVKYGRQINPSKIEMVSALNSFHGRTMGSLSITGQKKYQESFEPLLPNVKSFMYNDRESFIEAVSDKTCAVFLELIQGEGGINEITDEFLSVVSEMQEKYNFLLIIDEVQTGLGRTGRLFCHEGFSIKPDAMTVAKSLGGGLPLGALLLGEKCKNIFNTGEHGSTFAPNPVSAACGVKVLQTLLSEEFLEQVRNKSYYLIKNLNKMKNKYPLIINEVKGKGLMIGIDVGKHADTIKEYAFNRRILINVTAKSVVRLLPPLCITYDELDEFIEKFEEILIQIEYSNIL